MADVTNAPVVTVESLQSALTAEQADHAATKGNLANALNSLTEAAEIIDGQKQTIADLEAHLAKLQGSPSSFPTIVVEKKTYEVRAQTFKYKKVEYTVAQLLSDKALQKELVKKGVGFLVEKEA